MTASRRGGVLLAQMDIPRRLEEDFDDWYDTDHIPKRLTLRGFGSAERYHAAEQGVQRHAVVYHLDDMGVLRTPAYLDVLNGSGRTERTGQMLAAAERFTRYTAVLVSDSHPAAGLHTASPYAVFEFIEAGYDAGFLTMLYEQEVVPALVDDGPVDRIRRYAVEEARPEGSGGIVIYEGEDLDALRSARDDLFERVEATSAGEEIPARHTAAYRRRTDVSYRRP